MECRQVQLLNKELEGLQSLTGLPACAGVLSLSWLTKGAVVVCTTTAFLHHDFSQQGAGLTVLEGSGKQRFVSAACSPIGDIVAAGCVDRVVRNLLG